jgi:type II secretory pathway component PulF
MVGSIQAGIDISSVMKTAPAWLPRADRVFIYAAMKTGRLPQTLKNLSGRNDLVSATQAKVILELPYPLGVYNIAT